MPRVIVLRQLAESNPFAALSTRRVRPVCGAPNGAQRGARALSSGTSDYPPSRRRGALGFGRSPEIYRACRPLKLACRSRPTTRCRARVRTAQACCPSRYCIRQLGERETASVRRRSGPASAPRRRGPALRVRAVPAPGFQVAPAISEPRLAKTRTTDRNYPPEVRLRTGAAEWGWLCASVSRPHVRSVEGASRRNFWRVLGHASQFGGERGEARSEARVLRRPRLLQLSRSPVGVGGGDAEARAQVCLQVLRRHVAAAPVRPAGVSLGVVHGVWPHGVVAQPLEPRLGGQPACFLVLRGHSHGQGAHGTRRSGEREKRPAEWPV